MIAAHECRLGTTHMSPVHQAKTAEVRAAAMAAAAWSWVEKMLQEHHRTLC